MNVLDKDVSMFNEEFSKETKINREFIKNDEWTNLLLDFMSLKIKDSTDESIDSTDNIEQNSKDEEYTSHADNLKLLLGIRK